MKIYKIFNNNVIQTVNDNMQESIVIGSGIAYNKKVGQFIDPKKVEKEFVLQDSQQMFLMSKLLSEIPFNNFEISEKIISFAESFLDTKLSESIHITLADHIAFTLTRFEKGFTIKNPLLWDIKRLYESEFTIGLYGLDLIEKALGITLPEDEAGHIVMHIIDAQYNQNNSLVSQIMEITHDIETLLKYNLTLTFDQNSLSYNRFITHLKFFAQRVLKKEVCSYGDERLFKNFTMTYPDAYEGALLVKKYIETNHDYIVDTEELLYLSIHIQRLLTTD